MDKIKLTEICNPKQWKTLPTSELLDEGFPVYGANGIIGYYSEYNHENPVVAITCRGATCGKINLTVPRAYITGNAMCLDDLRSDIDLRYLYYNLLHYDFSNVISGSAQPQITRQGLEKVSLVVESVSEQERIVKTLDSVNSIIEAHQQELQFLDNLIKARFVEMFGELKESCYVGYYIKALIAGKSVAGEDECENKVLKTGAASFDYFDATQIKNLPLDYVPQKEHLVNTGDIIISRMNTAELTGAAAYVWDVPQNVYLPDRLWKAVLQDGCNPIFVWQMLIQPSTKEQIKRECSGTSGSMKNISKPGMLAIKVKKVPLTLQNQFAFFVTQIDKSKSAVQKALDKAQLLFDSLMQKYFG